MRESRESSRFSLNRKPSSIFSTKQFIFRLIFHELRECSKNSFSFQTFFFNISSPNSFSVHFLSEFLDSSVNSFSFSRLHSLKLLPYLSSVTSYVVCKAILFLLPPLCHVAAPSHNLPDTVFPKSVFLQSCSPYGISLQVLSHSSPPFYPSSVTRSCICTLMLLNSSWLSLH